MGLFDFIGGKIQQAGVEAQEAQMEAEQLDSREICMRLKKISSMSKNAGYVKALRIRCQNMSDGELKDIFDFAYNSSNAKACAAMMPIMQERELAYRDDNGRFVRKYR